MITVSDNTATNTLIDRLGGVDPVNRFVAGELGLDTISLRRKISFGARPAGAGPRPPLGEASPRHLMELISLMWRGGLVSPRASGQMLAILGRQNIKEMLNRR